MSSALLTTKAHRVVHLFIDGNTCSALMIEDAWGESTPPINVTCVPFEKVGLS